MDRTENHSGDRILLAKEVPQRLIGKGPSSSPELKKKKSFFLSFCVCMESVHHPSSRDGFVVLRECSYPGGLPRLPLALDLPPVSMSSTNQSTLSINFNKLAMKSFKTDSPSLVSKWNQSPGELLFQVKAVANQR